MDYILTIVAGTGIVLFLLGYLGFVVAGFKHHFVTGIISAFPILNIVTVPALWHNANKKLILSTFGLVILIASWFLGANTGIQRLISLVKNDDASASQTSFVDSSTSPEDAKSSVLTNPASPQIIKPYANQQRSVDESDMQALPKKALYKMSFEEIPLDKIQTLANRVVKIVNNNNKQLEGKVINITAGSIFIKNSRGLENELPIANIKKISMMVKKANQ